MAAARLSAALLVLLVSLSVVAAVAAETTSSSAAATAAVASAAAGTAREVAAERASSSSSASPAVLQLLATSKEEREKLAHVATGLMHASRRQKLSLLETRARVRAGATVQGTVSPNSVPVNLANSGIVPGPLPGRIVGPFNSVRSTTEPWALRRLSNQPVNGAPEPLVYAPVYKFVPNRSALPKKVWQDMFKDPAVYSSVFKTAAGDIAHLLGRKTSGILHTLNLNPGLFQTTAPQPPPFVGAVPPSPGNHPSQVSAGVGAPPTSTGVGITTEFVELGEKSMQKEEEEEGLAAASAAAAAAVENEEEQQQATGAGEGGVEAGESRVAGVSFSFPKEQPDRFAGAVVTLDDRPVAVVALPSSSRAAQELLKRRGDGDDSAVSLLELGAFPTRGGGGGRGAGGGAQRGAVSMAPPGARAPLDSTPSILSSTAQEIATATANALAALRPGLLSLMEPLEAQTASAGGQAQAQALELARFKSDAKSGVARSLANEAVPTMGAMARPPALPSNMPPPPSMDYGAVLLQEKKKE